MKLGITNVMTLTGKAKELMDFMEKENIELMERKRKEENEWHAGQEAKNGVGIIVKPNLEEYVEAVEYTSDKVMRIQLRTRNVVKDFIQVYAQQTGNKEENIEDFLEVLESINTDVEAIVMSDLYAHVGIESLGKEEIIGPYGYGRKNEEGEKLFDFCERNRMFLGNTWFCRKNSQKITRYGWDDRRTKTVIDYFLVEMKNRRLLMEVTELAGEV
ncbi:craniofacial development protein 2-like [Schistocerca cancellata]|uniref:craniofacial development protein 2-like n=1 Tax=Schistocerca cancellata TaxID=274614 RepID=UPI002119733A|nr:craniofacial development protein 2-like [Schistocerca cancellata]